MGMLITRKENRLEFTVFIPTTVLSIFLEINLQSHSPTPLLKCFS